MTGLLLIGVMIAWIVVAAFISKCTVRSIKSPLTKVAVAVPILALLLVAPLGDEIVGKYQFESLCRKYGRHESDFPPMSGKTLLVTMDGFQPVNGTFLEVSGAHQIFTDLETGKQMLEFHDYRSKGGWLIRTLGISETRAPLTFESSCGPFGSESLQDWLDRYHVKVVFKR